ncbi:ankyrin repeat domain-containing protein [Candidatus Dependentiae bacterium]
MKKFNMILVAFLALMVINTSLLWSQKTISNKIDRRKQAKEELKRARDKFKSELHKAIADENFNKIKKLVEAKKGKERDAYVNLKDYRESVPLLLACVIGDKKIIEYLIANGADVNIKMEATGPGPNTLLGNLAAINDKELLELLLKKGARVGLEQALQEAIYNSNLEIFKLLEKYGAKAEKIRNKRALLQNLKILKYVVEEKKFNMDPILKEGFPYNKDILKYLIEKKKLDVNAKNKAGTPLIFVVAYSGPEFVAYLISKGANIKALDKLKNTLLHGGALNRLDLVKFFVGKGLDVNAANKDKRTPLHNAAYRKLDVVKFLVNKGAKVNAEDKDKNIPLHNARNVDKFKFLVDKGADLNKFNKDKVTPLGRTSNLDVVKYVLEEKGKDTTLENIISSLGEFCKYAKLDLIKYILEKKGKKLTAKHIDEFIKMTKKSMQSRIDDYKKDIAKSKEKEWKEFYKRSIKNTKERYGKVIKVLEDFKASKK